MQKWTDFSFTFFQILNRHRLRFTFHVMVLIYLKNCCVFINILKWAESISMGLTLLLAWTFLAGHKSIICLFWKYKKEKHSLWRKNKNVIPSSKRKLTFSSVFPFAYRCLKNPINTMHIVLCPLLILTFYGKNFGIASNVYNGTMIFQSMDLSILLL